MDKKLKTAFFLLILFGIVTIGLIFWFSDQIIVLNPKGLIGQKQSRLLLISTVLMLIVVIPVFAMTFFFSWKYRAENKEATYRPDWDFSLLAESLWWGFPCAIVIVLGWLTWQGCHELDPFKPIYSGRESIKIQAVALQWKWLFIYPEHNIATVNYVRFPENKQIEFEITADAPMNSFWIPELGGQIYSMPGMRSKLHLIADKSDKFRGCSANISGSGFSGMTFWAESSTQEGFENWVQEVKGQGNTLTLDSYNELKKPSKYNPVALYDLQEMGLFDQIVMKYMPQMLKDSHAAH